MEKIIDILHTVNPCSTAFRIFLSLLLGGIIGFERGYHRRAAGLRTHILVCVGSTLTPIIGIYSVAVLGLGGDAMRIGAQVISGIGFLGAGTILVRKHEQVTGLTTAAGLWATASIGLAIGVGLYSAALFGFIAVMITISLLIFLEKKTKRITSYTCYIELTDLYSVNAFYSEIKDLVSSIEIIPPKSGSTDHVGLELKSDSYIEFEKLMQSSLQRKNVAIALPSKSN